MCEENSFELIINVRSE